MTVGFYHAQHRQKLYGARSSMGRAAQHRQKLYGARSSMGRAPVCGTGGCRFESCRAPQQVSRFYRDTEISQALWYTGCMAGV